MNEEELIKICFESHIKDKGAYFSFEEYRQFWVDHKIGDLYELKNKDGSIFICKIAYYPLPYYKDLRALIEIDNGDWNDFREVPVKFLKKII